MKRNSALCARAPRPVQSRTQSTAATALGADGATTTTSRMTTYTAFSRPQTVYASRERDNTGNVACYACDEKDHHATTCLKGFSQYTSTIPR